MEWNEPMPSFTVGELSRYFEQIRLPEELRHSTRRDIDARDARAKIEFIYTVFYYHASNIPWQGLASGNHCPHRALERIYNSGYGRPQVFPYRNEDEVNWGGHALDNLEHNIVMAAALLALGYDVYPTAVSTTIPTDHCHFVNIVTIEGSRFMLDLGSGCNNPPSPMDLNYNQANSSAGDPRIYTQDLVGWVAFTGGFTRVLEIGAVPEEPLESHISSIVDFDENMIAWFGMGGGWRGLWAYQRYRPQEAGVDSPQADDGDADDGNDGDDADDDDNEDDEDNEDAVSEWDWGYDDDD
ncbi:uncharacterized protein K452DRAFT_297936 [Aplosporella prunicola CBS 121167]|uniref:Uncharacterized protein n=1 Tax=Aplosporella prunicola CBS 121167 TaxID=1176127 RepID=A0A6A6BH87_9PEZI|nr:uncharacterized protein K452DRAFT_297936 [Aplosporella prunicola CBS 121167]KAF2142685.1 hypothetical protein K452DRAFT_297936 [Aplosporella prunicola CBS 121167]